MRTINLKFFYYALSIFLFSFCILLTKPAQAITGNFAPDPDHDYVGIIVFSSGQACSGSLLSPRIFLTAGHCIVGATSARVWVYQIAAPGNTTPNISPNPNPVTGYFTSCAGTASPNLCDTSSTLISYGFVLGKPQSLVPETKDLAVVVLDNGITPPSGTFANLASAGFVDVVANTLRPDKVFITASGYGLSAVNPTVSRTPDRQRLQSVAVLGSLNSTWTDGFNLKLSSNASQGKGGVCSGDSGGPNFYGDFRDGSVLDTIVAVTSFGISGQCSGPSYQYRTDQAAVLDFILGIAADFNQDITICDPSDSCVTCIDGVCPP